MTSDQLTAAQKAFGGLGPGFFDHMSWAFGQAVREDDRYGWDGGFGSSFLVDPNNELTVIVLTQRMFESPEPPQVHRDIRDAAYAALVQSLPPHTSARANGWCPPLAYRNPVEHVLVSPESSPWRVVKSRSPSSRNFRRCVR
jgi:hypothetical protein